MFAYHPFARARIPSIACLSALALLAACSNDERTGEETVIPTIAEAEIESLANKRVLFAHQSVGSNILDGVHSILQQANKSVPIAETREPPSDSPGIYHFAVGANGDPAGKIKDFEESVEKGTMGDFDVALVKLCYVDFEGPTDASGLAREYVQMMGRLQSQFPQTRFVAVTAPLTTVQSGPKAWVKRLLGKSPWGFAENAKRQEFNEILRSQFAPDALFDLAKLESATAEPLEFEGKPLESLDQGLTDDGGHLNDRGKALVGASFVKFLANLPPNPEAVQSRAAP